jgi:hypothetical protein
MGLNSNKNLKSLSKSDCTITKDVLSFEDTLLTIIAGSTQRTALACEAILDKLLLIEKELEVQKRQLKSLKTRNSNLYCENKRLKQAK